MQTKDRIISELTESDKFACELKDNLNITYRELWKAIRLLENEGKIIRYFRETPPSASLCFCLSKKRRQPLSIRWNRSQETGIKPWQPLPNLLSYAIRRTNQE